MTGLLKPFSWCNPTIYCIPETNFPIINSPVPIVAGVLLSRSAFEQRVLSLFMPTDSFVFVFLDEADGKKLQTAPNLPLEFIPPSFSTELKSELRQEYEDFRLILLSNKTNKIDMAFDEHCKIGMNFSVIIRQILEKHLVATLPAKPVYCSFEDRLLSMPHLQQAIVAKNPGDQMFCYQFGNTQMFAHFADHFYHKRKKIIC